MFHGCAPCDTEPVNEWPLTGRDGELARILGCLSAADPSGVLLAGDAGVGKSRLAREALRRAEDLGYATEQVTGTRSASGLPFGAFAHVLPPLDDGAGFNRQDRGQLLRSCIAGLVSRAGGRPLALLVDDAHLLDDASATLVHALAESGTAFIITTVRSGEACPDPVTALWKDGFVERIDLGRLTAESVEQLLEAVLDGPVDAATVLELAVRTQGNALFLHELVRGAQDEHTLEEVVGVWRLTSPLAPSKRLAELIEARLGVLEPAEAAVMELVAFAEPIGSMEVEELAGAEIVEALEAKGLVTSRINGRRLEVGLSHPLYGDVVRSRIPAVRLRRLARTMAEAVESVGARRREDTLRVATWWLEAGGGSAERLLAGARLARWSYNFALAERLARAAAAAGGGFEAALLAVQAAALAGAADLDGELAQLASDAMTDDERRRVAQTRLDYIMGGGDAQQGRQIAVATAAAIHDPAARDEILARASWIELVTDGPRAGADAALPVLERVTGLGAVWAALAGSVSLSWLGRQESALAVARRGREAYDSLASPPDGYPGLLLLSECEVLVASGALREAEALVHTQYQQAVADRSPEAQATFAWELAKVSREQGRVVTAIRYSSVSAALFSQHRRTLHESDALATLAWAQALAGQPMAARQSLHKIEARGVPVVAVGLLEVLLAQAWTTVAEGDLPHARSLLLEAAATGERIGNLVGATAALHSVARLGAPAQVLDRLAGLAKDMEGHLIAARLSHTRALAASDPEALEEASKGFEQLGAALLAAEAAADAAVAWRKIGSRRAGAAAVRATSLAAVCEGATTPALRGLDSRLLLTRAERDAAVLAAAGRSNKEIAAQFGISVRTVETQLQRSYEKLGISSRDELSALLGQ